MGLIPKRFKDAWHRRSDKERNDSTLLTAAEAARWNEASKQSDDATLLAIAQKVLTTGKLTESERIAAEAVSPHSSR